jgi:hypothetical protein
MAEKKADLVAKVPCVVYRTPEGRQVTVYEGAPIPRDAVDSDHLKMLEDEGLVGAPEGDKSK